MEHEGQGKHRRQGPLQGITVVEFAGLGPAPFAGMMLSDQGARVIRIDRPVKTATVAAATAVATGKASAQGHGAGRGGGNGGNESRASRKNGEGNEDDNGSDSHEGRDGEGHGKDHGRNGEGGGNGRSHDSSGKSSPTGPAALNQRRTDVLARGRESIALDLKKPGARAVALALIARADVVIEGFRPGVMESLGLGPDVCLARQPALVYGRVTGWGQHGPLAQAAGHDINYVALAGALHSTARNGRPTPAPGMIGDFGGGGMLLAFGVLAALHHARCTGQGQVVDAAICDGAALLAALMYGWRSAGLWHEEAGTNNGDGGAHFYDAYECADGKYVSVGAIEPQFYALLRERAGLDDAAFDAQWDEARWPALKVRVAEAFRRRTRAQWCELLEGTDACFAPVLSLSEAPQHPHYRARGSFANVNGLVQPAPAPRFSATPAAPCHAIGEVGDATRALLAELGYANDDIGRLLDGVAQQRAG